MELLLLLLPPFRSLGLNLWRLRPSQKLSRVHR